MRQINGLNGFRTALNSLNTLGRHAYVAEFKNAKPWARPNKTGSTVFTNQAGQRMAAEQIASVIGMWSNAPIIILGVRKVIA